MRAAKCFAVRTGKDFKLKDVDPDDTDGVRGKDKAEALVKDNIKLLTGCLLYTSPSPRD